MGVKVMMKTNSVVAIYNTHAQAEEAVKNLQKSGIDIKTVDRRKGLSLRRKCHGLL
jgi:hypothetical protein